jgi:SET domain-containing protein
MLKNKFDIQYVLDKLNISIEDLDSLSETGPVIDVKSSFVERKKSIIHGYGMFAKENIPKGNIIGMASIDNTYKTYLGRYTNHSSSPNIYFLYTRTNDIVVQAMKDIQKGEELFLDYTCHFLNPEYYKTTTTADS